MPHNVLLIPCDNRKTTTSVMLSGMEQSLMFLLAMFVQIQARKPDLRKLALHHRCTPQAPNTLFILKQMIQVLGHPPFEVGAM